MSQGAILHYNYSANVRRNEVLSLVRDVGEQVHAEVTDFSAEADPDTLPAGLQSSRVRLRRGRESVYLQVFERSDEAGTLDQLPAKASDPVASDEPHRKS